MWALSHFSAEHHGIRIDPPPTIGTTFRGVALLGASLAGQAKYKEAEPLPISGYEGMARQEVVIPIDSRPAIRESGERIVRMASPDVELPPNIL